MYAYHVDENPDTRRDDKRLAAVRMRQAQHNGLGGVSCYKVGGREHTRSLLEACAHTFKWISPVTENVENVLYSHILLLVMQSK